MNAEAGSVFIRLLADVAFEIFVHFRLQLG